MPNARTNAKPSQLNAVQFYSHSAANQEDQYQRENTVEGQKESISSNMGIDAVLLSRHCLSNWICSMFCISPRSASNSIRTFVLTSSKARHLLPFVFVFVFDFFFFFSAFYLISLTCTGTAWSAEIASACSPAPVRQYIWFSKLTSNSVKACEMVE